MLYNILRQLPGTSCSGGLVVTGSSCSGGLVVTESSCSGGMVVTRSSCSGGMVVTGSSCSGGMVVTGSSCSGGLVMLSVHFPAHTYSRTSSWLSEKSFERFRISCFSDSVAHNGYVLSIRYDCTHSSVTSHLFYSCMKYMQCNFLLHALEKKTIQC